MTDSVKLEMTQIDDASGQAISKVTCEWFGMDRDTANSLSMTLADGVVDRIVSASEQKAEISGNGMAAEALKALRRR